MNVLQMVGEIGGRLKSVSGRVINVFRKMRIKCSARLRRRRIAEVYLKGKRKLLKTDKYIKQRGKIHI